jgi:ATPase subunit of ABC transporter with duplicated ATPase domains
MLAGLQNVTFEFGARVIMEDSTWHIQPGERIGLIGYNGTGKSTLLKLLVGEYAPSKGTVERGGVGELENAGASGGFLCGRDSRHQEKRSESWIGKLHQRS